MGEKLLEIKDLYVEYHSMKRIVKAVNGISLSIEPGEVLGLVGETGAGKTTTALSILGLLPNRTAKVTQGSILFDGMDLLKINSGVMRRIRGEEISMIFQDPMTSLNPVISVGEQVKESLTFHNHEKQKSEVLDKRVDEIFQMVGIPANRKHEYPHQFSGGMKQRVIIAIALACHPKLLIADEPTTALDVTIQAQMLDLIRSLREKYSTSLIMITHDLGIVAEICDEVAVMYAGNVIEKGTLEDVFNRTKHPYTEGLFNSIPNLNDRKVMLTPIKGFTPDPTNLPPGCAFEPRCPYACENCLKEQKDIHISDTHFVRCSRYEENGFSINRKEIQ